LVRGLRFRALSVVRCFAFARNVTLWQPILECAALQCIGQGIIEKVLLDLPFSGALIGGWFISSSLSPPL